MANSLKSSLKNRMEGIADLIWPRITGPREEMPGWSETRHSILPELLEAVENIVIQRMVQAESRMAAVDRKLLSLFRLTSLLATIAIALLAGATRLIYTNEDVERYLALGAIVLILYSMLQLICGMNATIQGLEASRYASQTKDTILPLDLETAHSYKRRQIRDIMDVTDQHEWATNRKVDHMKIAYKAIRNTALPLVGLTVIATILACTRLGVYPL